MSYRNFLVTARAVREGRPVPNRPAEVGVGFAPLPTLTPLVGSFAKPTIPPAQPREGLVLDASTRHKLSARPQGRLGGMIREMRVGLRVGAAPRDGSRSVNLYTVALQNECAGFPTRMFHPAPIAVVPATAARSARCFRRR